MTERRSKPWIDGSPAGYEEQEPPEGKIYEGYTLIVHNCVFLPRCKTLEDAVKCATVAYSTMIHTKHEFYLSISDLANKEFLAKGGMMQGFLFFLFWAAPACLMTWIGFELSKNEEHKSFILTKERIKIILFCIAWPVSIIGFYVIDSLRGRPQQGE